jgi:hypothetical protein
MLVLKEDPVKRLFISHASEDKAVFVRTLASELEKRGVEIWYDEFELKPGDSIRDGIDRGLSSCDSGLCVFSHRYFTKKWTKDELGAIFAKESIAKANLLIPIWLDLTYEDMVSIAPMLADRKAIQASDGIVSVTKQILQVLIDKKKRDVEPDIDRTHRYYNPPRDIPILGYRFPNGTSYAKAVSQLRERELLFAYWQHLSGYWCACHLASEERFFNVARDAEVELYAVDRLKVEHGFDEPLPES